MFNIKQNNFKLSVSDSLLSLPTPEDYASVSLAYNQRLREVEKQGVITTIKERERLKAQEINERNTAIYEESLLQGDVERVVETIRDQKQAEVQAKFKAQEDGILSYVKDPDLHNQLALGIEESKKFAEGDLFVADRRKLANLVVAQSMMAEMRGTADKWWMNVLDLPDVLLEAAFNLFKVDYNTEDFVKANSYAVQNLSPSEYKQFLAWSARKIEEERWFDNPDAVIAEFQSALVSTAGEAVVDDWIDVGFAGLDATGLGLGKLIIRGGKGVAGVANRIKGRKVLSEQAIPDKQVLDEMENTKDTAYRFLDEEGNELTRKQVEELMEAAAETGEKARIRVQAKLNLTTAQKAQIDLTTNPNNKEARRRFKESLGATDDLVDEANDFVKTRRPNDTFGEEDDLIKELSIFDDGVDAIRRSTLPVALREKLQEGVSEVRDILGAIPENQVDDLIDSYVQRAVSESDWSVKQMDELRDILSRNTAPAKVASYTLSTTKEGTPAGYIARVVKGEGRGYSKEEAELLAEELGQKFDSSPVRADDGTWLVETNIPVGDLSRVGTLPFDINRRGLGFRLIGLQADVIDKNLHTVFQAGEAELGTLQNFVKKAMKPINDLPKKDFEGLNNFIQQTLQDGVEKWYRPNELVVEYKKYMGDFPTGLQAEAYYAMREINNFQYTMANSTIRKILDDKGYTEWTINTADGKSWKEGLIAKSSTLHGVNPNDIIFDGSTNSVKTQAGGLTSDRINDLIDEGYVFLRVESGSKQNIRQWMSKERADEAFGSNTDGIVSYALVKADRAVQGNLPEFPLPYVGGPRILYNAPHVIKAARTTTVSGKLGGFKQKLADVAVFSSTVKALGTRGTEAFNRFSQILKRTEAGEITEEQAEQLFKQQKLSGLRGALDYELPSGARVALNTPSGWRNMLEEFGIGVDDQFQLVRDGQSTSVKSGVADNPLSADGEALSSAHSNSRFQKRTSRRLRDVSGEIPFVNIHESLNRSFEKMARFSSFERAKELWANAFMNNYVRGDQIYLEGLPANPTIKDALNAKVTDSAGYKKKQEILAQQNYVKQIIGYDEFEEGVMEHLSQKIGDIILSGSGEVSDKMLAFAAKTEDLGRGSLVGTLKKYTFNVKLGMFRPDNMLQQTMTGLAAMAISPKYAGQAFKTAWHFNMANVVSSGGTNLKALKQYAKKIKSEVGDQDQFVKDFQEFLSFGGNNYTGNIAEIAVKPSGKVSKNRLDSFLFAGSSPFRFGDRTSRMMAYAITKGEIRDGVAKTTAGKTITDILSTEGREYGIRRMNALTLGMSRADVPELARTGIGGMALQFMAYPMRMLGVFFGKTFTTAEKARLGAFYFATAGAGGIPLATTTLDYFEARHNMSPEAAKFWYNGLVDSAMLTFFDADTDFSSTVAAGEFVDNIAEDLYKMNIAELLGGASASTVYSGAETFMKALDTYAIAGVEFDDFMTEAVWDTMKNQVVSLNRIEKAYLGWQMGFVYDNRGGEQFAVSKKEAALTLFGFPYGKRAEIDYIYGLKRKDKEVAKIYNNMLSELSNKQSRAMEKGDEAEVKRLGLAIRAALATLAEENTAVQKDVYTEWRSQDPQLDRLKRDVERRSMAEEQ